MDTVLQQLYDGRIFPAEQYRPLHYYTFIIPCEAQVNFVQRHGCCFVCL